MILNISEASLHLGFLSRSTLQRLVQKGHLNGYRVPNDGREVLLQTEPPGQPSLREVVQTLTQFWREPDMGAPPSRRCCPTGRSIGCGAGRPLRSTDGRA